MKVNVTDLVIRIILTAVVFGVVLFLPAGTLAWPAAWVYLVLLFSFTIGVSVWLSRFNPELLSERVSGIGKPRSQALGQGVFSTAPSIVLCLVRRNGARCRSLSVVANT